MTLTEKYCYEDKSFKLSLKEFELLDSISLGENHFNGAFHKIPDNNIIDSEKYIFKTCSRKNYFSDNTKYFVSGIISKNLVINGVALPEYTVYDEDRLLALVIPFFKNTITFESAIKNGNIDFLKRTKAVMDVVNQIKKLHKSGIVARDIHLGNYLIDKNGKGFTVDIDGGQFIRDPGHNIAKYLIITNNCIQSDLINQFVTCMSLVLDYNMEKIIFAIPYGRLNLYNIINNYNSNFKKIMDNVDNSVNDYFFTIASDNFSRTYLSDISSFFTDYDKVDYVIKKLKLR